MIQREWFRVGNDPDMEFSGLRRTTKALLLNIGGDSLTLAGFLLVAWIPWKVTKKISVPNKTPIRFLLTIFLLSILVLVIGFVIVKIHRSIRLARAHLTPPYDGPSITWEIPYSDIGSEVDHKEGYIKFESVAMKAGWIGLFFLFLWPLWSVLLMIFLLFVSDPVAWVNGWYAAVPNWLFEVLLGSVSNVSNISTETIAEQTQRPAQVTVLVGAFGPMVLLITLALWNFMYAAQLTVRRYYHGL